MTKTIITSEFDYEGFEQYSMEEFGEVREPEQYDYETHHEFVEEDIEVMALELKEVVKRHEKRYNTHVDSVVFFGGRSSHYGSIGGNGASVGRIADLDNLIELFYGADIFRVNVTDEGTLEVIKADHDGSNYMEMYLFTVNQMEKIERKYGWDYDDEAVFYYLEHDIETKNPFRLDKEFKRNFGIN